VRGRSASALRRFQDRILSLIVFSAISCLGFPVPAPSQANAGAAANPQITFTRLEPDQSLEKTLAGGHSDTFEIAAAAGQFLHIVVEQLGIDVALTLSGPNGKQIGSMDSPNGAFGLEQISAIADTAGSYRLQVSSGDNTAPSGRYTVKLAPLKSPSDADRARIIAERLFSEAVELQGKGDADSLRSSAQKFVETLPMWEAANDSYEEALTLDTMGEIYSALSDNRKALDYFQRALPLFHVAEQTDGEAATLSEIGATQASLGDWKSAISFDERAISLAQSTGDRGLEARTLINVGLAHTRLGEKQKALECYERVLPITQALGDTLDESIDLNNLGRVNEDLGEYSKAQKYFSEALPLQQAPGARRSLAITLNNIGRVHDELGEEQEALDYLEKSLSLRRQVGDRSGEATTLNNIAVVYEKLGLREKALENYGKALALHREIGNRFSEALDLHNIGEWYVHNFDSRNALDYFNQALPVYRELHDPDGEALTLNGIGQAYCQLEDFHRALQYFNQALPLEQSVGSLRKEAITYNDIARVYEGLGDRKKAIETCIHALALATEVRDPLEQAFSFSSLMTMFQEMGNLPEAAFYGKQAVSQIERVRSNISGLDRDTQQSFLKLNEKVFRDLAEVLITQGRLPEAQQVLDLLKVEEYSEFIHRRGNVDSDTKPVPLTPMEERASKELGDATNDITAIGSEWSELDLKPSKSADEEKRFQDLSAALTAANQRLQNFLNGLYDTFGKGDQANEKVESINERTGSLKTLMGELGPNTVALYTLVLDQKCVVMVITPATRVAREFSIDKIALRGKVFAFVSALAQHQSEHDIQLKAQDLYNILIAPIEKDLRGAKATTLVWSLDDVLRYVPLSALYDGKRYMVERFRNVVITIASVLKVTNQGRVNRWNGLAMGVSKDYDGLGALNAVPSELSSVVRSDKTAGSHGPVPGTILLDDSFTETSMETALGQHPSLVHIASHYVFQPGDDKKSYLLLGGKEAGGKGFHLTLADLRDDQRMDFRSIELLTLSGCQTAVGSNDSDGREIDGLGITAQRKGAKAVMATLWPVDDASVGVLMATFYKLWTGTPATSKAGALQQAQLELLRSGESHYANPYYWAPFILIGDWK
jgi:CHAT domain-containing protein/tetratricopeptide (TPR) repeat protein